MGKVLTLSINGFIIFLLGLITGCNNPKNEKQYIPKTLDEYYKILENSTIEMELFVEEKRATCFYSNDSKIFVFSIKYHQSKEYGYLYDITNNELYNIENHDFEQTNINKNPINIMTELLEASNFLFHLKYDYAKFEYKETTLICNKTCDVYRFTDKVKDQDAVFNVYIDQETGLCLKAVCSIENLTYICFEAKKFSNQPSVDAYYEKIESYKK